ncbi:MAG: hypothetical protein OEV66_01310, partial [Spirochaetia bacterium]|nr:hypothetical protein [Spirochaetia bacterium]
MERKKQLRNSAINAYPKRSSGKNSKKPVYGRRADDLEKSGSGELADLFKKQASSSKNAPISYRAFEIIPRNSPYNHHFKALLNAESFISRKEFQMALDIYQRMLNKIPVRSSREKMEQNIKDIEGFLVNYDEPFSPKVQLDISYAGPSQPNGQAGAGAGSSGSSMSGGGMSMPIQIQMTAAPQGAPPPSSGGAMGGTAGSGGMMGGGSPGMGGAMGAPNWAPNAPNSGGSGSPMPQMPAPFGFFQALAQTAQDTKDQSQQSQNKPFGFFDKVREPGSTAAPHRASEDIEPANNTEKLLKELSEGIFQIEKAIFETNKMKVESEETPEISSSPASQDPGEQDKDSSASKTSSESGKDSAKAEESLNAARESAAPESSKDSSAPEGAHETSKDSSAPEGAQETAKDSSAPEGAQETAKDSSAPEGAQETAKDSSAPE